MYRISTCLVLLILLSSAPLAAKGWPAPAPGEDVIGEIGWSRAGAEDALVDIAKREGLGYEELVQANPLVDRWLPPAGATLVLPTRFVLPHAPRSGIVVNVPEMRLYYFPPAQPGAGDEVLTFPIAIGRDEWRTPIMQTRVIERITDPVWRPTPSIRREYREETGEELPTVVPAGPENPLGRFALRLGTGHHLIHGTNKPFGIGMKVTHGCIRLYTDHMAALFPRVAKGTAVYLVDQPYKLGWNGAVLYLEAHTPAAGSEARLREQVLGRLQAEAARSGTVPDLEAARLALTQMRGVPVPVLVRGGATAAAGPGAGAD